MVFPPQKLSPFVLVLFASVLWIQNYFVVFHRNSTPLRWIADGDLYVFYFGKTWIANLSECSIIFVVGFCTGHYEGRRKGMNIVWWQGFRNNKEFFKDSNEFERFQVYSSLFQHLQSLKIRFVVHPKFQTEQQWVDLNPCRVRKLWEKTVLDVEFNYNILKSERVNRIYETNHHFSDAKNWQKWNVKFSVFSSSIQGRKEITNGITER